MDIEAERDLRDRIFVEMAGHVSMTGGTITRLELSDFPIGGGSSRRLVDQSRGIWNPKDLRGTLSVVSDPNGPYADRYDSNGLLRYSYRKYQTGSVEGDNTKLRAAMQLALPIILLRKIETNLYMPVFPVYVIDDDARAREFLIALDEEVRVLANVADPSPARRRYAERIAWQRLHQPEFRIRVLRAYETRCTVCTLRHRELLDAAHIVGDRDERGEPVVPNGLSLCKIHHAAFDQNLMGISPDGDVRINADLLAEIDGPMLEHGLQAMHGRRITVPRRAADHPDRSRLDQRYQAFLTAA